MPYLILSDASLAFGHVPLLDHADFQLDAGERVALIGRNGTGKSSLLSALAGCGALDDGKVWLQHDSTDAAIADQLVARGIPADAIVLGFQPEYIRQYSGFAVQ